MLSIRQAASRPNPPLPSAASGSAHLVEIDTEIAERRLDRLGHAEVLDDIGKEASDQKFEREVVNPLAALGMAEPVDREPAMDDAVAQRQGRRDKPVARRRGGAVLADRQGQFGEDARLERLEVGFARRRVGDRSRHCRFGGAGSGERRREQS